MLFLRVVNFNIGYLTPERLAMLQKGRIFLQPFPRLSCQTECMEGDRPLIDRALQGDRQAYELLIRRHERLVGHILFRMGLRYDEMQDLSQEIFIRVCLRLDSFRGDSKLSTWIASVAYRQGINYLKRHRKQSFLNEDVGKLELAGPAGDPSAPMEAEDNRMLLHRAMERLPPAYRTVLSLYHLEEFSYQEIQEITGMPEGTVKNYLFRARKMLKDVLEKARRREEALRV